MLATQGIFCIDPAGAIGTQQSSRVLWGWNTFRFRFNHCFRSAQGCNKQFARWFALCSVHECHDNNAPGLVFCFPAIKKPEFPPVILLIVFNSGRRLSLLKTEILNGWFFWFRNRNGDWCGLHNVLNRQCFHFNSLTKNQAASLLVHANKTTRKKNKCNSEFQKKQQKPLPCGKQLNKKVFIF